MAWLKLPRNVRDINREFKTSETAKTETPLNAGNRATMKGVSMGIAELSKVKEPFQLLVQAPAPSQPSMHFARPVYPWQQTFRTMTRTGRFRPGAEIQHLNQTASTRMFSADDRNPSQKDR
jgi:hypothetical protein